MLTSKERFDSLFQGRAMDRAPYLPALYDYKPSLLGCESHLFGSDASEVFRALKSEVEILQVEALTAAYDIYNIECEALGGIVRRDAGIGMPEIENSLIQTLDQVDTLPILNAPSGRMPVFIEAARKAVAEYGATIPVRGAVTGPFTLASKIFQREELLMECLLNPEGVQRLFEFCTHICKMYAGAILETGAEVVVFDSFVSPPMLSPKLYSELVLPYHQSIFASIREQGGKWRPLIVGGNTLPLLPYLVECGANQLLLDYSVPMAEVKTVLETYPSIAFRYNLAPLFISSERPEAIRAEVKRVLDVLGGARNLILGTGILPTTTPRENILAIREAVVSFYENR